MFNGLHLYGTHTEYTHTEPGHMWVVKDRLAQRHLKKHLEPGGVGHRPESPTWDEDFPNALDSHGSQAITLYDFLSGLVDISPSCSLKLSAYICPAITAGITLDSLPC